MLFGLKTEMNHTIYIGDKLREGPGEVKMSCRLKRYGFWPENPICHTQELNPSRMEFYS